jgi:hypothetical protein
VYAKGYFDGLEAARKDMTPARFESSVKGLTGIAKKVFEATPIDEAWTPSRIISHIGTTTGSRPDQKIVTGCLDSLMRTGLVCERPKGLFQRIKVKERTGEEMPKADDIFKVIEPGKEKRQELSVVRHPKQTAFDVLCTLAERLKGVGAEIGKIAAEIEVATLEMAQGSQEKDEELEKLKQLKSLLQSFKEE